MEELTIIAVMRGEEKRIKAQQGQNLLASIRAMGFSMRALCGERGTCGSCKVKVIGGAMAASEADTGFFSEANLLEGWRLACTAYPTEDVRVELNASGEDNFAGVLAFQPPEPADKPLAIEETELAKSKDSIATQFGSGKSGLAALQALGDAALYPDQPFYVTRYGGKVVHAGEAPDTFYAIAIDIGTTTLGFALVDLQTANIAGRLSMVNRQREYGADVVTRIIKAKEGGLAMLSGLIRTQLAEGCVRLCSENGVEPRKVIKTAIAGNTTMLHLLLELRCDLLGRFPFTPVTLDSLTVSWRELFGGELSCDVDILPGISTYVGADITAGLLYTMMHRSESPAILLDIGTNGEMALANGGSILCTSTAAGPALEGVNITWGTGSIPGAISSVHYGESGFTVSTIGGQAPVGICGSGVIEAVYRCFENRLMDATGRFQKEHAQKGAILARTVQGEEICLSQKDIREVQLAKSAIRSGIDIMIRRAGLEYEDIGTFYVAGGFGYNINFDSGVGIGLVPGELKDKIKLTGNSSLAGAVSYLIDPALTAAMDEIISASSEFSLSEDEDFQHLFIANMSFTT